MWSRSCCAWRARWARFSSTSSQLSGVEVALDRHLRVDDDALAAGELHDQVGAQQAALVVAAALLGAEVAVVEHAGELDDALQLHLAPAAADVGGAQRGDEAAGLGAQLLLALGDGAQLLADAGDLVQPPVFERLRLHLELLQRLLDRRELRLGQGEQRGLALQERIAGGHLEAVFPLALALLGERQLAVEGGDPRLAGADRAARPEEDGATSDEQSDAEKCERHGPTNGRDRVGRTRCGRAGPKKSAPASPKTYRS